MSSHAMVICPKCGARRAMDGAELCWRCSQDVVHVDPPAPDPSRMATVTDIRSQHQDPKQSALALLADLTREVEAGRVNSLAIGFVAVRDGAHLVGHALVRCEETINAGVLLAAATVAHRDVLRLFEET